MKRTWLVVGLVAVVAAIVVIALVSRQAGPHVIKVAFIGPLTGDNAIFGVPQKNAAQLAVEHVNAAGGVLGRKVELVVEDGRGLPEQAVSAASKVALDSAVVGVVGHPNSGCAIPASKVYHDNGLLFVTSTATNPKLTDQGFDDVFRFAPTDDVQGRSDAEFIFTGLGKRSLVLLHDNAAYGKGIADQVRQRYMELGGKVILEDAIDPQQRDFKLILSRIRQLHPPVIFYGGMLPEGTKLVKQAGEVGLETLFVFGDGCYDSKFRELAGTPCRNVLISFLAAPVETMASARKFYDAYKARYGDVPTFFTPYAYDAVNVVLDAVRKARSADRAAAIRALRDPNYRFQGVTGPIRFNGQGQDTNRSFFVYTFSEAGDLVLYEPK